jgi:hypothetical protein
MRDQAIGQCEYCGALDVWVFYVESVDRLACAQCWDELYVPTVAECPYCGRVMSHREEAEQGACNDCYQA